MKTYPYFLYTEIDNTSPDDAFFHVIPAPYEKTVSYGKGTAEGPGAILLASGQLELYDGKSIPAKKGIYTQPPIDCSGDIKSSLNNITRAVSFTRKRDKFPMVLGGEHGLTPAVLKNYQDAVIGVVHFDAHGDLRDSYEGSVFSHACAAKRLIDMGFSLYQIGVRSLSYEEVIFRNEKGIQYLDAETIYRNGFPIKILPDWFPEHIYLTVDIDVLDPSIMPATGTPEPGGLSWYQLLDAVTNVLIDRIPVGMDIVEFSPVPSMVTWSYTAARLVYNLMGIISRCI